MCAHIQHHAIGGPRASCIGLEVLVQQLLQTVVALVVELCDTPSAGHDKTKSSADTTMQYNTTYLVPHKIDCRQ